MNKLTYVVHQLSHLCDDNKIYGCLKSAYNFENNSGKIVWYIKHGKNVLENVAQQIYNRTIEKLQFLPPPKNFSSIKFERKCLGKCNYNNGTLDGTTMYEEILLNGIRFDDCDKTNGFQHVKTKFFHSCMQK